MRRGSRHAVARFRGAWTSNEDATLFRLVMQHGEGNWSCIARELNASLSKTQEDGRIGKQCRERWTNHLRLDLKKDEWTAEEEELLVSCHQRHGNRWSDISREIPGRSENAVKNHWNATLRRKDNAASITLRAYMSSLNLLPRRLAPKLKEPQHPKPKAAQHRAGAVSGVLSREQQQRKQEQEQLQQQQQQQEYMDGSSTMEYCCMHPHPQHLQSPHVFTPPPCVLDQHQDQAGLQQQQQQGSASACTRLSHLYTVLQQQVAAPPPPRHHQPAADCPQHGCMSNSTSAAWTMEGLQRCVAGPAASQQLLVSCHSGSSDSCREEALTKQLTSASSESLLLLSAIPGAGAAAATTGCELQAVATAASCQLPPDSVLDGLMAGIAPGALFEFNSSPAEDAGKLPQPLAGSQPASPEGIRLEQASPACSTNADRAMQHHSMLHGLQQQQQQQQQQRQHMHAKRQLEVKEECFGWQLHGGPRHEDAIPSNIDDMDILDILLKHVPKKPRSCGHVRSIQHAGLQQQQQQQQQQKQQVDHPGGQCVSVPQQDPQYMLQLPALHQQHRSGTIHSGVSTASSCTAERQAPVAGALAEAVMLSAVALPANTTNLATAMPSASQCLPMAWPQLEQAGFSPYQSLGSSESHGTRITKGVLNRSQRKRTGRQPGKGVSRISQRQRTAGQGLNYKHATVLQEDLSGETKAHSRSWHGTEAQLQLGWEVDPEMEVAQAMLALRS